MSTEAPDDLAAEVAAEEAAPSGRTGVPHLSHTDPGAGLWIGLALGLPVIAWGVRGLLEVSRRVEPAELGRWIVGGAILHDAVAIPVVLGVGSLLRRRVPAVAWAPVRWALTTSAVAALVAWPFVRGYGRTPLVPSLLARNYSTGLIALVVVVWALAAVWAAVRVAHMRRVTRRAATA